MCLLELPLVNSIFCPQNKLFSFLIVHIKLARSRIQRRPGQSCFIPVRFMSSVRALLCTQESVLVRTADCTVTLPLQILLFGYLCVFFHHSWKPWFLAFAQSSSPSLDFSSLFHFLCKIRYPELNTESRNYSSTVECKMLLIPLSCMLCSDIES
jgi:hypothetical protein